MFNINDTVIYGSQGVCKITGTETKSINHEKVKYFILKPVFQSNSTIFVPADNKALTDKMKSVLSREDIIQIIKSVSAEDTVWTDDDNTRKDLFREALSSGDRREIIKIIKTIRFHKKEQTEKGKRLHQSDEQFLKEAEGLLYDEFAIVLEINPEKVLDFIMDEIEKMQ